jgi:hypothetical protein
LVTPWSLRRRGASGAPLQALNPLELSGPIRTSA